MWVCTKGYPSIFSMIVCLKGTGSMRETERGSMQITHFFVVNWVRGFFSFWLHLKYNIGQNQHHTFKKYLRLWKYGRIRWLEILCSLLLLLTDKKRVCVNLIRCIIIPYSVSQCKGKLVCSCLSKIILVLLVGYAWHDHVQRQLWHKFFMLNNDLGFKILFPCVI